MEEYLGQTLASKVRDFIVIGLLNVETCLDISGAEKCASFSESLDKVPSEVGPYHISPLYGYSVQAWKTGGTVNTINDIRENLICCREGLNHTLLCGYPGGSIKIYDLKSARCIDRFKVKNVSVLDAIQLKSGKIAVLTYYGRILVTENHNIIQTLSAPYARRFVRSDDKGFSVISVDNSKYNFIE
jgi:hypothetical protein